MVGLIIFSGCVGQNPSDLIGSNANPIPDNTDGTEQIDKDDLVTAIDGDSDAVDKYEEGIYSYEFPDELELTFFPRELVQLEEAEAPASWEFWGQIPLGEIDGKRIELSVYQETDSDKMCGSSDQGSSYEKTALLEFNDKKYQLNDCLPHYFLQNFPEPNEYAYILPQSFTSENGQYILHAAVELSANGHGRMLYIFYDIPNDGWYSFWDWGYPFLVDLDASGDVELVNQFAGGGLQWPDATIYRWNDGVLEGVDLKGALDINLSFNEVSLHTEEGTPYFDVIAIPDPSNREEVINVAYRYENGKLIKMK